MPGPSSGGACSTATNVAAALAASFPSLEGVWLFGSVARGDETQASDVDMLIVSGQQRIPDRRLRRALPADLIHRKRLSLEWYTWEEARRLFMRGGLFVVHLRYEGRILFDRHGLLRQLSQLSAAAGPSFEEETGFELQRLKSLEDADQFNDNFLFCYARLYSIGKSVVMLRLAREGILEFSRDRALQHFAITVEIFVRRLPTSRS